MKGLYITFHSISNINKEDGVWKKIEMQINSLNKSGISITNYNFNLLKRYRYKIISLFNPFFFTKTINQDFYKNDFYYIRFPFCTFAFLNLLKNIKKHGKGKIIVEIPTFPYDGEIKSYFFDIIIDKFLRNNLKKYVDVFTTYSIDNNIYGIPAIHIINGIYCSNIPVVKRELKSDNSIHLIAVAMFSNWHGYDRLINGINLYYKKTHKENVYLHLVGAGKELIIYNELVKKYNLFEYVLFHGMQFGENLFELMNNSDIAVCSLGCHRKNIFLSSELKSREYLASGLPIVSSTKIDVLPEDYKYCLYVPEDENPIDIHAIINFYTKITFNNDISHITKEIRQFAEEKCDMNITMKPVIDYINNIS